MVIQADGVVPGQGIQCGHTRRACAFSNDPTCRRDICTADHEWRPWSSMDSTCRGCTMGMSMPVGLQCSLCSKWTDCFPFLWWDRDWGSRGPCLSGDQLFSHCPVAPIALPSSQYRLHERISWLDGVSIPTKMNFRADRHVDQDEATSTSLSTLLDRCRIRVAWLCIALLSFHLPSPPSLLWVSSLAIHWRSASDPLARSFHVGSTGDARTRTG
jgi:hypothetical protein